MKNNRLISLIAVLGFCVSFALSCSENTDGSGNVPVTGVHLDREELILRIGNVDTLSAYVLPGNATNRSVTWSSSNPSVIVVDILSGALRAIAEGSADIAAETEDGGFQAVCKVTVRKEPSVYAAGGDGYSALLWKDGEPQALSSGGSRTANSLFLDREDVYVTGYEYENGYLARVWKNGEQVSRLEYEGSNTYANSIYVEDGDVYACGYTVIENPRQIAPIVWKNGVGSILPVVSTYAEASAVAVEDGRVYVAGYDYNPEYDLGNYMYGVLWQDGLRNELTDGNGSVYFTDMFITDGNLYISGYRDAGPFIFSNGSFTDLPAMGSTVATSVYVYNGDVYACGYIDASVRDENSDLIPRYIAVMWKNGEMSQFSDGTTAAMPMSIWVSDGNVYIGGSDSEESVSPYLRGYAVIWKNGEQIFKGEVNTYISDIALTE